MKRSVLGRVIGYSMLTVVLTAGAAQSLSGSNTVFSDDIVNGNVTTADIKADAVNTSRIATGSVFGSDIADNALTGADVNETTLVRTCPTAPAPLTLTGDVCFGAERPMANQPNAQLDCLDEKLRLPTVSEAMLASAAASNTNLLWTSDLSEGSLKAIVASSNSVGQLDAIQQVPYRCVTTVGARP